MNRLIAAVLLLFPVSAAQAAERFVIDNRHSTIAFEIGIAGGLTSVEGSFDRWDGAIDYDPSDPSKSSVRIRIETASINTGVTGRDNHLRSADFFDAAQFPEITFQSERVHSAKKGLEMTGPLTMHGVTKPVQIAFRRMHEPPTISLFGNDAVVLEGTTEVRRSDFDIRAPVRWNSIIEATGEAAMSDTVGVRLRIIAQRPSQ